MAAIIDFNHLASIQWFRERVQSRLLVHALGITSKAPAGMAEEGLYQAARNVVQSGGQGAGNVPLIVAAHLQGDYAATDADIDAAINARKSEIYNVPIAATVPKYSPMNQEFIQTVRRGVAREAQRIVDSISPTDNAARKSAAVQALTNINQVAIQIAQLASDNPKGDPLTDASTQAEVNKAIKDAFNSILPASGV